MSRNVFLILASLFVLAAPACGGDPVGRASVVDGDTIEIHGTRIRLFGIDAPEGAQVGRDANGRDYRCGQTAANALADYLGARPVAYIPRELARYGRTVAACAVRSEDIGDWLVRRGARRRFHAVFERKVPGGAGRGLEGARRNVGRKVCRAAAVARVYKLISVIHSV
jgi:endonuclease YncB( thermonuclease family)